ncbi:hypothetical protein N7520_009136 [Penicillium odoratum]|uniref:uncharacterized protein n=1 Tax=Penicillium odoratum TaxID=1167516 RepID=UPI002546B6A9|nr:uncharacterized protein N7520_009136 [Penicillium odoratum]KAJ5752219.1 hypothetical protein N7520_009136 [Penicillium odoratum]
MWNFGSLGPRTEHYGFEVSRDQFLTKDICHHGPKVLKLQQTIELPILDGNPLIDYIIEKC